MKFYHMANDDDTAKSAAIGVDIARAAVSSALQSTAPELQSMQFLIRRMCAQYNIDPKTLICS